MLLDNGQGESDVETKPEEEIIGKCVSDNQDDSSVGSDATEEALEEIDNAQPAPAVVDNAQPAPAPLLTGGYHSPHDAGFGQPLPFENAQAFQDAFGMDLNNHQHGGYLTQSHHVPVPPLPPLNIPNHVQYSQQQPGFVQQNRDYSGLGDQHPLQTRICNQQRDGKEVSSRSKKAAKKQKKKKKITPPPEPHPAKEQDLFSKQHQRRQHGGKEFQANCPPPTTNMAPTTRHKGNNAKKKPKSQEKTAWW